MVSLGLFNILRSWYSHASIFLFRFGKLFILDLLCFDYRVMFSLQLLDVVYREETLLNVIRSVTRNGRSIILTAVLALILVYMFSIIGYMFFKDDFLVTVDDETIGKVLI